MTTGAEVTIVSGTTSLQTALITATVAVGLWIASRLFERYLDDKRREEEKEKTLRALFAEIDFNTYDLVKFIRDSPGTAVITKKIEEERQEYIPHISDARHTEIYRNHIDALHHMGNEYISDVILFYGYLEKIKSQIDSLSAPSYVTISVAGKCNVIRIMIDAVHGAAAKGEQLLIRMDSLHHSYKLERNKRDEDDKQETTASEARQKLEILSLELDRIRSTHNKSS